jgi:hypothetical protein
MAGKFLTKEEILGFNDLETVDVFVNEWEANVRIRTLSAQERDSFEKSLFKGGDPRNRQVTMDNFRAKFISLILVDEKGDRLFSEDDVAALGLKSASAIDHIFAEGQKLSGITKQDVEDLTKK